VSLEACALQWQQQARAFKIFNLVALTVKGTSAFSSQAPAKKIKNHVTPSSGDNRGPVLFFFAFAQEEGYCCAFLQCVSLARKGYALVPLMKLLKSTPFQTSF